MHQNSAVHNRLDANIGRHFLSADDVNSSNYGRRMTMKTRVAIRDKSPHRFEVIPLRDAKSMGPLDEKSIQRKGLNSHTKQGPLRHYSALSPDSDLSNHSPGEHMVRTLATISA